MTMTLLMLILMVAAMVSLAGKETGVKGST